MDAAIIQNITTKLTKHGIKGSSITATIPSTSFYNVVLSNANILDITCSKQQEHRIETNQTNRTNSSRSRNQHSRNSSFTRPQTKYTGLHMKIGPGVCVVLLIGKSYTKVGKRNLLRLSNNTNHNALPTKIPLIILKITFLLM
jgi:hypothetical protein